MKMVGNSGKHHCRRCGRTVCTRCWNNLKRLCKDDPGCHKVCDNCDFEISNYQMEPLFKQILKNQQQTSDVLAKKLEQEENDLKAQRDQRKSLEKEVEQKVQDFK